MAKILFCLTIILGTTLFYTAATAQDYLLPEVNYTFLNKLIATAKANYPKMKSYGKKVDIARLDLTKARDSWFDVMSFSLSYSPTNTTTVTGLSLSGYQLSVSLNFGSMLLKHPNIKQAKLQWEIAKLDNDEYNLQFETEVKTRYLHYLQAQATMKMLKQNIIDIEGLLKQTKYKFEKAEETFDNYSKALIAVTGERQNVIASEVNLLIAKSSLEEIICKKLEEVR